MRWTIEYYSEAVIAAIEAWPVRIRAVYARITERMEVFGPNLGMPFTRSLGSGLFEIRARGREGIGRAFFCTLAGREIRVLHALVKKSQKTPRRDLELARLRLKEVLREDA